MNALEKQMDGKKKLILAKVDKVNSAAMKQAMTIFEQTGQYPKVTIPTANTVGAQALQAAISRLGDPYIWGAAGPGQFDCSGLVMWAYEQVGISLPHYTGSQWNSGMHVARSDLEPGDLVFFFPNISHVVLVQLSIYAVGFIKAEVILSFLGFGVPVDVVSWGSMLNEAQNELILGKWWQLAAAGTFMAVLVTAFSLFTDALRDALDPKLK